MNRPFAVSAGLLADHLLGEPPQRFHPLRFFGRFMEGVERELYAPKRLAGALYAAIGTLSGSAAGGALGGAGAATFVSVGGRCLDETALEIMRALEAGDLEEARQRLPALVGRDSEELDEKEIARAVVESVAENTVDAVVAPVFWATAAGGPGALGYRAVNTMDAVVGHHTTRYEDFGWAAAKLDDLAGWLPARITALLVALVTPAKMFEVLFSAPKQARSHPSPNAGLIEAAFACALGVVLGGENSYGGRIELRPVVGTGRPPEPADIERAVELSRRLRGLIFGFLVTAGAAAAAFSRSNRRQSKHGTARGART